MRLFRVYLKDECMSEIAEKNAVVTIQDCLGNDKVQETLRKLSQGYTIELMSNWTIKEKF